MSGYIVVPISDIVDDKPSTLVNSILSQGPSISGLDHLIEYKIFAFSDASPVFSPPIVAILPTNSTRPSISGSNQVGQILTANEGVWQESPVLTLRWLRSGTAIPNETNITYTLSQIDIGLPITLEVTATNQAGSVVSISNNSITPIAANLPPLISITPSITGTTASEGSLTISVGSATGNPTPTSSIQWRKDGANIAATGLTLDKTIFGSGVYSAIVTWSNGVSPNATSTTNEIVVEPQSLIFLIDAFSGRPDGTDLVAHTSNSGSTWSRHPTTSGNRLLMTSSGFVYPPDSSQTAIYLSSVQPSSENSLITADIVRRSNNINMGSFGIIGRCNPTLATFYMARANIETSPNIQLFRSVNGTVTQLGSNFPIALNDGQTISVSLRMIGSEISALLNGSPVITVTDTSITSVGRVGLRSFSISSGTPSSSLQISSITAENLSAIQPPVNTLAPAISGIAQVGQTITGTNGTWSGSPTITAQWLKDGNIINGETSSTYLVQPSDLNSIISRRITAVNSGGTIIATSNSLGPIAAPNSAPTITSSPTISGTSQPTGLLTIAVGTATGNPTPTSSIQWRKDGANIAATSSTVDKSTFGIGAYNALITWSNGVSPNATIVSNGIIVNNPPVTTDTFTSGSPVNLTSYIGESGFAWIQRAGATSAIPTISGGLLTATANSDVPIISREQTLDPNQFAEATIIRGTNVGSAVSIAVRMNETGSCYFAVFNAELNSFRLFKTNVTSSTLLLSVANNASNNFSTEGATALLRIEARGSNLSVLLNGTQIINVTDTDYPSGRVGVRTFRPTGVAAGLTLTNFNAGNLDVNQPPPTEINFTSNAVYENTPQGTIIGNFS